MTLDQLFIFALIGLGTGAVYAALGLGLVVTFKATGVLNFAAAATGVWSAFVYSELRVSGDLVFPVVLLPDRIHLADHLAAAPALLIATATGIAAGIVIYVLVFRPLRTAPALAKVVASAGVMLAMQALVALRFGIGERPPLPLLPTDPLRIAGAAVPQDRLWLAAIVITIAVAVAVWFRSSTTGLAMRAAAENEQFVSLARFSPTKLAAIAWALSAGIIGFVAVLAAPVTGLNATNYTLLIVPGLACALVGRLTSITPTVAAGFVLGALGSVVTYLSGRPGWPAWAASGTGYTIPCLAIVITLIVRGKTLPTRDTHTTAALPRVPRPRFAPGRAAVLLALGVLALAVTSGSYRFGLATSMIFAIMALSLVVLTGLLGQVSLAQAALAGTAGFVLSKLTAHAGIGFPLAPLLAAGAATVLGVLAGTPALRIRGAQLAVVTLAAAVAIEQFVFRNIGLVGLINPVPAPHLFGLNLGVRAGTTTARLAFGLLCLAILALCAIAVVNLTRSATGRRFLAVRSNERASAAVGVNVARTKLLGFAFSAFLAGLSGCLLGYSKGSLSAESFTVMLGISILLFTYLGGITSVGGALLAGTFAPLGITFVIIDRTIGASSFGYQLAAALALIVTAIVNPEGIIGRARRDLATLWHKRPARFHRPTPVPAARAASAEATEPPAFATAGLPATTLSVEHLTVRYAGVTAVDDVSLTVHTGQIIGLIGANGAGKTSLIDALSGFTPATGTISLHGDRLDHTPAHRRARTGLARTWQSLELFADLTVEENLRLAADPHRPLAPLADLLHPARAGNNPDVDAILALLDLTTTAHEHPAALSLGQRKLVNVARALATRPRIVLLDEPAAGLSRTETRSLGHVLRMLADNGIGILLVEHDISWVLELCETVHVLDFGHIIASGAPADVRHDPAVVTAYLGTGNHTTPTAARTEPLP